MKYIEVFTDNRRVDKTTDISKIIPFELIDSIENTVLDLEIQENGGEFKFNKPIIDSYGRELNQLIIPPIKLVAQENSWVLDNIQMKFNTVIKVHNDYINNRCDFNRVQNAAKSYLEKGLATAIWGKKGLFRNICIAHRTPHSVRAVALPNANYGIDEVGIPRNVMLASDRKHGDPVLITRFPAIWEGSIEILRARTSNNSCIEIHPLLHSQLNLDHDGDTLTGYWVPNEPDCIDEAIANILSFFKANENSWPTELCMNGYKKETYSTVDLDALKIETKQRLIPDGFSIDPMSLLTKTHNLDEITDKNYAEDIYAICKGISRRNFYDRSIDINVKNLTMKMFMGPVGVVSNDVKLVGSNGPIHVRDSTMYISEAIQQSLMDSKHEVGNANNMRFMKLRNAIAGNQDYKMDINKIIKCIEENDMNSAKAAPFVIYMYIFKPLRATLDEIYLKFNLEPQLIKSIDEYYSFLINQIIEPEHYQKMLDAIREKVKRSVNCSKTVFEEMFKANTMSLSEYIVTNFPRYCLVSKSDLSENNQRTNELCTRVIVDNESDLYGCCADEFAKFGD